MAKRKNEDEAVYVDSRVRATADGEFEVVGHVEGATKEVVLSTHSTVDEAIKAQP